MKGYRASTATLIATLLLAVASCGQPTQSATSQRLWTMADLELSFRQNPTCVNPPGLDCKYFVDDGNSGGPILQYKPAFSEGQPMGYITTDFWANYPQIWLEPMYILVTAWNDNPAAANRLRDANGDPSPPIFSIGTQSAFWSPFWQTVYVEVPVGTSSMKYTSTRQLFDDHLVMHPGPNRFASIAPDGLARPSADDITDAILKRMPNVAAHLKTGTVADIAASSKTEFGWLDGVLVPFFDFGTDNFEANADQEIQDVPLFLFKKYDTDGALKLVGFPNVGGVAPLFSHVPGRVSATNRPQFGALWRLHVVTLPKKAGMFTTDDEMSAIIPGGMVTATDLDTMVSRVALDTSCFLNLATKGLTACTWLDSQRAIEDNLGEKAIQRTDLQPACPFVMFNGLPVPFDPPPPPPPVMP